MNIRDQLNNNPIIILMVVGVAIGSVTIGIANYFYNQKLEIEKARMEAAYKEEISKLSLQISSYALRIGTNENHNFDISQIVISSEGLKELDASFKSFSSGLFFLAEPTLKNWKYEFLTRREFANQIIAATVLSYVPGLQEKKSIHLWKLPKSYVTNIKPKKEYEMLGQTTEVFFPYIYVDAINQEDFLLACSIYKKINDKESELVKTALRLDKLLLMNRTNKQDVEMEETKKDLEKLLKDSKDVFGIKELPNKNASWEKNEALSNTSGRDMLLDTSNIEIDNGLKHIFDSDMNSVLLTAIVSQCFEKAICYENVIVSIEEIEKRNNVLHIKERIKLSDVNIGGYEQKSILLIDKEYFIVTNPKTIFYIEIQVPSTDGRSEAYLWSSLWLRGLRIPQIATFNQ